jgi:hypothetical protein
VDGAASGGAVADWGGRRARQRADRNKELQFRLDKSRGGVDAASDGDNKGRGDGGGGEVGWK